MSPKWGVELHCRCANNNTSICAAMEVFFVKLHFSPCLIQPLAVYFRQFHLYLEGDRRLEISPNPEGGRRYPYGAPQEATGKQADPGLDLHLLLTMIMLSGTGPDSGTMSNRSKA
jgi:hypothetical protein